MYSARSILIGVLNFPGHCARAGEGIHLRPDPISINGAIRKAESFLKRRALYTRGIWSTSSRRGGFFLDLRGA